MQAQCKSCGHVFYYEGIEHPDEYAEANNGRPLRCSCGSDQIAPVQAVEGPLESSDPIQPAPATGEWPW